MVAFEKGKAFIQEEEQASPRANGRYEIFTRVEDNAYKVAFLDKFGRVSTTFNIEDLALYLEDENLPDLRTNPP